MLKQFIENAQASGGEYTLNKEEFSGFQKNYYEKMSPIVKKMRDENKQAYENAKRIVLA